MICCGYSEWERGPWLRVGRRVVGVCTRPRFSMRYGYTPSVRLGRFWFYATKGRAI